MPIKTTFLVTPDNPNGWTLEALLTEVQNDMFRRCQKILDDPRSEARAVLQNNVEILSLLSQAIAIAEDSTKILKRIGPHVEGQPRIGVL